MINKKSIRGRTDDNEPNPIDIHVGKRIRLRRTILHITQQQMAEMLGLTFQQVQKYEKGQGNISAARLFHISKILSSDIGFFFEDGDNRAVSPSDICIAAEPDVLEFLQYRQKVKNKDVSVAMRSLLNALSTNNPH